MSAQKQCRCIIRHPQTKQEQTAVKEALAYARKVGDMQGIMITLAQLTGKCDPK